MQRSASMYEIEINDINLSQTSSNTTNNQWDSQLSKEFFKNLTYYENQLQKNKNDTKMISKAIVSYIKCIEQYESLDDPIKCYFEEKFQKMVDRKKGVTLLGINNVNDASKKKRNSTIVKMELYKLINLSDDDDNKKSLQELSEISSQEESDNDNRANIRRSKNRKKSKKSSILFKEIELRKTQTIQNTQLEQDIKQRQRICKLNLINDAIQQYGKDQFSSQKIIENELQKISQKEILKSQIVDNQVKNINERLQQRKLKIQQSKNTIDMKDSQTSIEENQNIRPKSLSSTFYYQGNSSLAQFDDYNQEQ